MGLITENNEQYYLGPDGQWNSWDENYGNYQFITIKDIINNFMISYVCEDKIIPRVKRTDVIFHAMRGIQEFSFDILPSVKSQEIELGHSLGMILPQDYVNYVKLTWTDSVGLEHVIYPAINTSNPKPILHDHRFQYLFDEQNRELLTAEESETKKRFDNGSKGSDIKSIGANYGRRYGLTPSSAQSNGVFYIDQSVGIIYFDSSLSNKIITLKYVSDGVSSKDEDITLHKFAEEAMYKHIAHSLLSTRTNVPEYMVARFKKEKAAAKRNTKLRLSNIKIEEIAQVMRNKSKQIKH